MSFNCKYIDNHTHGSFGINFNNATYDEMKFVLKELYKKNIKGICPTLVGDCDENIYNQLKLFKQIKNEQLKETLNETFIIGVHLEGTFLSSSKVGIQDNSVFKKPTIENFKNLAKDCEDVIKIVTIAPEENIDLIEYLNKKNIKTQAGHTSSKTMNECAGVTHIFNAMNTIHHREPSVALEGLLNEEKYIEVIGDLFHISLDMLKLILKVKPKNRIILISDSLPLSNHDKDIIFCNKKINKDGKDDNGVIAGSIQTLDSICELLIKKKVLTKEDINYLAFENQINYLNLDKNEINILNR